MLKLVNVSGNVGLFVYFVHTILVIASNIESICYRKAGKAKLNETTKLFQLVIRVIDHTARVIFSVCII